MRLDTYSLRRATGVVFLLLAMAAPAAAQPSETEVRLYGFVLFNAAYNTGAPAPADIPVMAGAGEEGSFLMTARQSRLGLQARHTGAVRTGATIELDLWGLLGSVPNAGPTQSAPRTRLAFFTLGLSETSTLLFGQTWAVVAPLNPNSLSHQAVPMFSSSGNLWNRLPQIRYTYSAAPVIVEAAVLRPFAGEVAPAVTQIDYLSAGEYSRLPFFEARAAFTSGRSTFGLSGRYGRLDLRSDALREDETSTYVLAADVQLGFENAGVSGEVYTGRNNRGLFGLAATRVANGRLADSEVTGGWGQLSLTSGRFVFNAGAGIEDVDEGARNRTLFANGFFNLEAVPVTFALELAQVQTTPPGGDDLDNLTINFAARYSFP